MKILFTTGAKPSVLTYTLNLCSYLQEKFKVEICIITTESIEEKFKLPDSIKVINSGINTVWQNDFNLFAANMKKLDEFTSGIIKDFNPDIIHFNHIGLNPCKKPNVLHFHDDILNQLKWQDKKGRNFPYLKMHKQFRHFVLGCINDYDCILSTSRFCALNILKTYNVQKPFKFIDNSILPIDMPLIEPKRALVTVLDEYNRKNSIKHLSDLKLKLPSDIKIFVISDKSQSLLNSDNIRCISPYDARGVEEAFINASIYMALGNWDYFNHYAIQASLRNCAILANDIPFYREFWKDIGVLFERNNFSSLIKNINNLIENPNLMQKVAYNCKSKALSKFSLKINAGKYFNLYSDLIKQGNKISQGI